MNHKLTSSLQLALMLLLIALLSLAVFSTPARTTDEGTKSSASPPNATARPESQRRSSLRHNIDELVLSQLPQAKLGTVSKSVRGEPATFFVQSVPSISSIFPSIVSPGSFSLTINGSNFNTSTAQIVVTGPNCPTTTSCVVPNGVLTTKTSTRLVGPLTINTAGTFTIQVQNGSGATLSNGASLSVSNTPSISSISPSTVTAGTFSLTINGSNFNTSNAQIVVTGPNCPTTTSCVVPNGVLTTKTSTRLVGPVTITTPGTFTIQVQNGSGTTLSNGASLTVNPPTPSISSISPTTVTAGTFSLTINGSNFNTSNAQIVVTGPNCPTTTSCVVPNGVLTTKTSTRLVGPVTITTPGSFTIQVQNGSGTTLSNGASLTVNPATPAISSISPTTVTAGTFSLTINGSNFNPSTAQIVVTGPNCPTTTSCVVPNGVLTTKASGQLVGPVTITTPGSFTIQVQNGSGTTLSNGASLTVNSSTPSISSISPTTVTAGTLSLTINGSNFNTSNAQIVVTGPNCPTTTSCVVPNGVLTTKTSNQLVGPVTITTPGSFTIQVQNGAGTTLSNGASLTVNPAAPSISNISPTTVTAGTFTLTINGSNFNTSNAQIVVTGPNCPTTTSCVVPNGVLTTKTSNQLVGPVTITTPGSFTIQVQNGLGTTLSNGATLTVNSAGPSISNISPTTATAGTFSLTINGSNFNTSNAQIVVTGPNCPTTSSCVVPNGVLTTKTSNQLGGPVTINTPGSFTIQVQNGSGTTLSNAATLTVNPIVPSTPQVTSISPQTPNVDNTDQNVTVLGNNFQLGLTASVTFPSGGTANLSGTQIQSVTANSFVMRITLGQAGSWSIRVNNPDGGQSPAFGFAVQSISQPPGISSINPSSPLVSNNDQDITVFGVNFRPDLTVTINFPNGGGTTLSGAQIQNVSSSSFLMRATLSASGTWSIRVNNSDGSQSSFFSFSVGSSGQNPVINSINPASPLTSGADQNVIVNGNNFQAGLKVDVSFPNGGVAILQGTGQIQQVANNSFLMRITLNAAGSWTMRVINSNGTQSAQFGFTVQPSSPSPTNLPTSVLSPVIGPLRTTQTNLGTPDGKWEFNQHKTGAHSPVGGISSSNDTLAWDVNLYTSTSGNADAGKAVYAVADGEVISYVGTAPGSGPGAVLIAHPTRLNPLWFSGYLHMKNVRVSLNESVNQSTVLGEIGRVGADNDHLHFVVYSGSNSRGNLQSFNVAILERLGSDTGAPTISAIQPNTVDQAFDPQLITISGFNFQPDSILEVQDPNGQYFTITPEALSTEQRSTQIVTTSNTTITAKIPFRFFGNYSVAVINRSGASGGLTANATTDVSAFSVSSANVIKVNATLRRNPLIIIPGIMGSRIGQKAGNSYDEIFPSLPLNTEKHLLLRNSVGFGNPIDQRPIVATDIFRDYAAIKPVYGPFIDALTGPYRGYRLYRVNNPVQRTLAGCDLTQTNANLFVFPYDWRSSNEQSARDLKGFVDCIKRINDPNNSDPNFKVDIVAHSMGGLVARRYILEGLYGTFQNYDPKVDKLITLGTPWLGAPKFILALENGEVENISTGVKLMSPDALKEIVRYLPGAHELIPSRAYTEQLRDTTLGDFPFGENGWDFNGNGRQDRIYDFSSLEKIMNRHTPDNIIKPGTNSDLFHNKTYQNKPLQDNWSGDQTGVKYYNFVGRCLNNLGQNNTVGSLIATSEWYRDWVGIWREKKHLVPKMTRGDCTVPEISGMRQSNNGNYLGPAIGTVFENVEHLNLVKDSRVFSAMDCVLAGGSATTCVNQSNLASALTQNANELTYNVRILGSNSIIISDAFGNTSSPFSSSVEEGVATISTTVTGHDSLTFLIPHDQTYKIMIRTSESPLVISVTDSDGPSIELAVRYVDLGIPPNLFALLEISPTGVSLKYDGNGNGDFETLVNPTTSVTGTAAQDLDPPVINVSETVTNGTSQITLTATDSGVGVQRIMYSLNGTTYQPYTGTFGVDPLQNPTVYAFAEDAVSNRSAVLTFTVSSAKPIRLMLEDQADSIAALDSLLLTREPFVVLNNNNLLNRGVDRNTRLIIFVRNLQLTQGELPSSVIVELIDSDNHVHTISSEDVRPLPNTDLNQITFRLPDNLPVGITTIKVKAHNQTTNSGSMRIK